VLTSGAPDITVVNGHTLKTNTVLLNGTGVQGLVIDRLTNRFYIDNAGSNNVSVFQGIRGLINTTYMDALTQ